MVWREKAQTVGEPTLDSVTFLTLLHENQYEEGGKFRGFGPLATAKS